MDFEPQVAHQETTERQEPRSAAEIQYELERNKPMPSFNHSVAQHNLGVQLEIVYGKEFQICPELEIQFPTQKAVPDISIYPKMRMNWQKDQIRRTDLPNLVIEILSPRQAFDDIMTKMMDIYFPAGIKSAWVVLPSAETIMIFKPDSKAQSFTSGLVKDDVSGFEVNLDKIF
jgi:Uma2 family endonuclease